MTGGPDFGAIRSYLFVPSGNRRFVSKVSEMPPGERPGAVVVDLEDAVPEAEKGRARGELQESVKALAGLLPVMVRVNPYGSPHFDADVRQAVMEGVCAVFLPKARDGGDAKRAADSIAREESAKGLREGSVSLVPLVESAAGCSNLKEICSSTLRLSAVGLGPGDYAMDMGLLWSKEGMEYGLPRSLIPMEARAVGLPAIDGVYMDVSDAPSFEGDCRLGRRLGYSGRMVVHPAQVGAANRLYRADEREREWAERVKAAYEEAAGRGRGAVKVDGQLVDLLHYKLARRILSSA
ncbi:MAG: CoA ester lyase [Nitrososphaerota archaeon]|nr:CoA ester lyase [Nitrososphaerota archaeon]MDG6939755.1 CoA ester lyase [Nitrososphaerota archaeon]